MDLSSYWQDYLSQLPRVVPDEFRANGVNFPSMPESVLVFSHVSQDPSASLADVAEPLERDPAQSLELLRYVNSVAMGNRRRITTVPQALSILGVQRARTLILCSALQRTVSGNIDPEKFRRQQQESVERAIFAAHTTERLGGDSSQAYVAGLLQDLMLPALMARYPDFYNRQSEFESLAERELNEFGWTHADAMAEALRNWNFPNEIVCAVAVQHRSEMLLLEPSLASPILTASVLAAAIPNEIDRFPLGAVALPALHPLTPDFSVLEVAVSVDEAIDTSGLNWPGRSSLCERLADQFEEQLNNRRLSRIVANLRLGSYTLESKLGAGGMGTVYLAHHDRLKRPAAVKLFNRKDCTPEQIARFESEVQIMSMLRSPHAIHVYDYGITRDGLLYYVMEHVPGDTLEQYVERHRQLSQLSTVNILRQCCVALQESHNANILHGDISARNIMITQIPGHEEFVKILDFGLATIVGDNSAKSEVVYGTPQFLAPEILRSPTSRDVRSEIYSLGAAAYLMLTGRLMFQCDSIQEVITKTLEEPPLRPALFRQKELASSLENLVLSCLAKLPELRPQSMTELLQQLEALVPDISDSGVGEAPIFLVDPQAVSSGTTRCFQRFVHGTVPKA